MEDEGVNYDATFTINRAYCRVLKVHVCYEAKWLATSKNDVSLPLHRVPLRDHKKVINSCDTSLFYNHFTIHHRLLATSNNSLLKFHKQYTCEIQSKIIMSDKETSTLQYVSLVLNSTHLIPLPTIKWHSTNRI